jgi:hypothetical protein
MKLSLTNTARRSSFGVLGLVAASLALGVGPASAAPGLFQFDTTINYPHTGSGGNVNCLSNAQCDIALQSVKALDTNTTWSASQLFKVTHAALLSNSNDQTIGGVSIDRGDLANGLAQESLKVETGAQAAQRTLFNTSTDEKKIVKALGQSNPIFNLNNILDTEDNGKFTMDLLFDGGQSFDSILLWERGLNSKLRVQAITKVAGNQATGWGDTIDVSTWRDAGYSIDTTEISGANSPQRVGSQGIHFGNSILGVRLFADSPFNGPDFKIAAVRTKIPEPGMLVGLGAIAGMMAMRRMRRV